MPRYTRGEYNALIALTGGDTSEAADLIGVDGDYLQAAADGRKLPRPVEKEIERALEDYRDENPDESDVIERVGDVLEWYPELITVIDNDGVAETLRDYPEFTDVLNSFNPGVIEIVVNWATQTKAGGTRVRQRDLSPFVDALIADDFDIRDKDSQFWRWFRSIYPG